MNSKHTTRHTYLLIELCEHLGSVVGLGVVAELYHAVPLVDAGEDLPVLNHVQHVLLRLLRARQLHAARHVRQ